jgi:heme/copper-type cytochrome/quinol oxidase subunit 1
MAVAVPREGQRRTERLERIWKESSGLLGWLTTVDHKRIGILYFFTSLFFFAAGGVEALLIRTQLIAPNQSTLDPATFN